MLVYNGLQVKESLDSIAKKQEKNNRELIRLKNAHKALKPVAEKWDKTFIELGKINDLVDLYKKLRIKESGLNFDRTNLQVDGITYVSENDQNLGLIKICLSNSGGGNILVNQKDINQALNGLTNLDKRKDVKFGSVQMQENEAGIQIKIHGLCVFARS